MKIKSSQDERTVLFEHTHTHTHKVLEREGERTKEGVFYVSLFAIKFLSLLLTATYETRGTLKMKKEWRKRFVERHDDENDGGGGSMTGAICYQNEIV
jgi:hypothetical protein